MEYFIIEYRGLISVKNKEVLNVGKNNMVIKNIERNFFNLICKRMVNFYITGGVLRIYINGVMFFFFYLLSFCCRFSLFLIVYFNFFDKWY